MNARRILAAAVAASLLIGLAGCAATQSTVKQVVEQGVEPTSTGPHNVAPANSAQNAVGSLNKNIQQTQQNATDAGQ